MSYQVVYFYNFTLPKNLEIKDIPFRQLSTSPFYRQLFTLVAILIKSAGELTWISYLKKHY